jgi:hypothetical protein
MAITVKNMSTGYVSLPRPFVKTLSAGASATEYGVMLDSVEKKNLDKLKDMENAGLITVTEIDETLERGSLADASVADVEQLLEIGQAVAANGAVSNVLVVRRPSVLKRLRCYFDLAPTGAETITFTLTRNGNDILNAAFVVDASSTLPSEDAVLLADDLDNTDGAVLAADPDELSSAGAAFVDGHIGNLVLLNSGGTNDGAYLISARTDANNVDLTDLEGTAAAFTDESGIEWDMVLAVQEGDILALGGTMANNTSVTQWVAQLVVQPR